MRNNQLFDVIADILIEYIEHTADSKRGLRADYADLMSANSWRSRNFEAMVDQIAKNVEVLDRRYSRGGRLSEIEVLEAAIPEYVDGHFAFCCVSDKRISDKLDDRVYDSMSNDADKWEREWGDSRGRSRQRDEPRTNSGSRYGNRQEAPRHQDRSYRGGERYNVPDPRDTRPPRDEPSVTSDINDPWSALANAGQPAPTTRPARAAREPDVPVRTTSPKPVVVERHQGIDFSKPRPYDEWWEGDKHYRVAYLSDWKLSNEDGEKVLPSLYDVNTHIRYLVKHNSGHVTEEILAVTNDSRYLQQELLYGGSDIQAAPRTGRRVTADGGVVNLSGESELKTKPTPLADIMKSVDTDAFADICGKYTVVADLREAAMAALLNLSNTPDDTMVMLSPYLVKDPVILIGYAANTETLLDALIEPNDLHAVRNRMLEMREGVLPELWDKVNERLSKAVKESCRYQWQFGFKVFDFAEHFLQMLDRMRDIEGDAVVKNFIQRSNSLIDKAGQRFTPEEAIQHLSQTPRDNGYPNAVVFADFEYLFAIRKTADELGLGKQLDNKGTGVAVNQLEPNLTLSTTIRNIYRALPIQEYERTTQCIRLVTSDNKIVSIYPYMGRQDQFIISQAVKN